MIASAPGSARDRLAARVRGWTACVHTHPSRSFVVAIRDRDRSKEAIRTKFVLEVADGTPERRIIPAAEKSRGCPVSLGREYGVRRIAILMPFPNSDHFSAFVRDSGATMSNSMSVGLQTTWMW